ncbi:MAG TPA: amidohydrolase family protein [Clostridia bacterium]|nr:amidohydrolase family protein [Clostridia bacterium]
MANFPIIDCLYSPEARAGDKARLSIEASEQRAAPSVECSETPASLLERMDGFGMTQVLLSPCRKWTCERHWMCGEIQTDEIVNYIAAAPHRFAGLAGYNPYAISESLLQLSASVRMQDMRGVYVPTENSTVALGHARMYPLYARCVELNVPVMTQVGLSGQVAHPSELEQIAADFPEVTLVAAWSGAMDAGVATRLCEQRDQVYVAFNGLDASESVCDWLDLWAGMGRCMWGSNGRPWHDVLTSLHTAGLNETTLQKFLHDNAVRVFRLDRASAQPWRDANPIAVAER